MHTSDGKDHPQCAVCLRSFAFRGSEVHTSGGKDHPRCELVGKYSPSEAQKCTLEAAEIIRAVRLLIVAALWTRSCPRCQSGPRESLAADGSMAARLSEVSVLLALCAAADCCLEPYWFRPEAGIEQVACGLHCFILIGGPYGRVVKDGRSWRRSSGSPSVFFCFCLFKP